MLLLLLLLLLLLPLLLLAGAAAAYFFKYEPDAAVEATPSIFGRYLVTKWRQLLAAADAFRAQHWDNLGNKSIFPPANYHLPRR